MLNREISQRSIVDETENNKEKITIEHHRAFALDGISACGKSHLLTMLQNQVEADGLSVKTHKISGFGSSERVNYLRKIKAHRSELILNNLATEAMMADEQKDRIMRLATRQQVNEFTRAWREPQNSAPNLCLLDRTPLTCWAFSYGLNPQNTYLPEILEESLQLTARLPLECIYIIDVSPITAYARTLARVIVDLDSVDEKKVLIDQAQRLIQPTAITWRNIIEEMQRHLTNIPNLKPKKFSPWDFIPYQVKEREREGYLLAAQQLKDKNGINFKVVSNEGDIDKVVADLSISIKSALAV